MKYKEIVRRIEEILQDFMDNPELRVDEKTIFSDIKDWDSLALVTLVAGMEAEYSVSLDISGLQTVKCVGDFAKLIA